MYIKIQIVSQYYYPDNFRINDIAPELVKMGYEISVLTSLPDYATSYIPHEYRFFRKRRETENGVQIIRVPTIARRKGILFRVLNYASFAFSASIYALLHPSMADVIFVYQPSPVSQILPATLWRQKDRPVVLYCCDIWPEAIKAWDISESNPFFRLTKSFSSWLYRQCDIVAITSRPFRKYLVDVCKVSDDKIKYLPQHAEDSYAEIVGIYEENGCTDFLFAGNIGAVQNIDCILRAVSQLSTDKAFCVHIVGDGSELAACKQLAVDLGLGEKVIFHGRHPLEKMTKFYRIADCFLLTLRGGDFIGMTLPSKAQGYLCAGKPIIAAIDGAGREMIVEANCGGAVPAGDDRGLAVLMLDVIENPDLYHKKGTSGRVFYEQNYTRKIFMKQLVSLLEGK